MFKKQWSYLQYGNRFCGIEHTTKDGKEICIVSLLKKSKTELDIENTFESETIEEVSEELAKNQHAHLVINNDNVLSKQLESDQNDALKLVYKAFPNINLDDFYFEVQSEKKTRFIVVCRKDYVDSIIEKYTKNKIFITNVSFGNTLVSTIKAFIDKNQIYTSNARITIDGNYINKIEKSTVENESYIINGITVFSDQLLSLTSGLQYVLQEDTAESNFQPKREFLLNDFKQTRFFNQFLKFAGIFILGLLLINFLFFSHYFNKVNELKQVSQINESTKQKIITLKESVTKKQKMVDDLLKSDASKSSFYINEIVSSLPKTLLLSEINFQPLQKRIKPNKSIELSENVITVTGVSNNSESFSNWISKLEQTNWINKVDIVDYGSNSNSSSDFKIKVQLTND